jgi:hypothetical protein
VTGTDLDAVVEWTLTGSTGDTVVTADVDDAGTSAVITLDQALEADNYQVTGEDAEGVSAGAALFEVVA